MRGLSAGEQKILEALKAAGGQSVSYDELHAHVRRSTIPSRLPRRQVEVRIRRIKSVLGIDSIRNISGKGYAFIEASIASDRA